MFLVRRQTNTDVSLQSILQTLADAAAADGRARSAARRCGRVRHFDDKKGYGFITPRGGGPDVFFFHKIVQGDVGSASSWSSMWSRGRRDPEPPMSVSP